ncbi:hypothetical protein EHQ58_03465 [Leptospira ognonensis]|uniref:Lipoprotein n=1 Tax=Leptospira ognonensis TaxID=2484945 RepID=A0A4R9K9B3_9LEPT|nr:hypothetical protein [Leptospira ognonensis]TGL62272.1 hypothetical protein EHQ58_03465 [Leptospira ognonensis]
MKAYLLLPSLLIILALFGCDTKDDEFSKKYETTLLLTYISTPTDANAACVSLSKKQEECFSAPAVALGISVPSTSDSTLSTRCVDTLKSSQFNQMSAMAQTCVITCQVTDWNTKISSGECKTGTASSFIQSSLTNTVVSKCIRDCFSTSNGLVTDENIAKLFIFNFIQQGE